MENNENEDNEEIEFDSTLIVPNSGIPKEDYAVFGCMDSYSNTISYTVRNDKIGEGIIVKLSVISSLYDDILNHNRIHTDISIDKIYMYDELETLTHDDVIKDLKEMVSIMNKRTKFLNHTLTLKTEDIPWDDVKFV